MDDEKWHEAALSGSAATAVQLKLKYTGTIQEKGAGAGVCETVRGCRGAMIGAAGIGCALVAAGAVDILLM